MSALLVALLLCLVSPPHGASALASGAAAARAPAPPLAPHSAGDPNCTQIGEALCTRDGACAAFGVLGQRIQLHGCALTVPNADWTIYVRDAASGQYRPLPLGVNVDEEACAQHPRTGMEHSCSDPPPPPPPPAPPLYTKLGAVDVGTFENTIFYWQGVLYNLENIACSYWDHAGVWDASWGNNSYARVRELLSGRVVSNISSTKGFGFVSAFPDYEHGTLWLFGTPANRCQGNGNPRSVQAWWTRDLRTWQTALVLQYPPGTHNVQVTKVGPMGGVSAAEARAWYAQRARASSRLALPPHRYAMYLECFAWAINNNADGDLTQGWTLLPDTAAPPGAPCGGPSMRFSPTDNFYYILTGGREVYLYRTQDFKNWEESSPSPFISPSAEDALISPFSNFAAVATVKGSPPNKYVGVPEPFPRRPFVPYWGNWTAWARNSNDGDICCMHRNVTEAFVIWGASTQGHPPGPPLTGSDASTNSVATAAQPLDRLLAAYFP